MAPTQQQLLLIAQAKRKRAEADTGGGQTVNPMVAQGRHAVRTMIDAGVKEVRADNTIYPEDWKGAPQPAAYEEPQAPFEDRQFERMYGRPAETNPQKPVPSSIGLLPAPATVPNPRPTAPPTRPNKLAALSDTIGVIASGEGQNDGSKLLQSGMDKLGVKSGGRENPYSESPNILGGLGDLVGAANFSIRDWWRHSSDKDKENLIASIPIEATGAGAIARLSDHIGQKTGNDFLVDKTGNFKTDASYDPVAELEMYALNAGSWSTRNQLGGVINPRAVTRSTVGPQLPGVRQALASPTLKEVLPHAADVATNMTMGGSDVATAAARGGVNLAKDVGNALRAGPAATPPPAPVTAAAANPSVAQPAPTAVPPTQPRPAGAGQQPNAGNAAPTAGAVPPVINATQVAPGVWQPTKHQIKVAKDTTKITTRLMRSAGLKDADVQGYLPGAVQRYKSLNDSRVPFAFFLERDLPQHFPEAVADEIVTKLQGWGRERNASTASGDPSRSITQKTIKTLRGSQQDFITNSAEANLFKGSLIGQEDQILKSLRETGKKGYEPVLAHARDAMEGRRVPTPAERAGFEELRTVLSRPVFRDRIPNDVRMTAEAEGLDLLELIERDPVTAAHWLQSNLNKLEDAAEINGRATPASLAYGRMRTDVLEPLKQAAPGYAGALNRYGHDWGAKSAVSFGRGAFTAARSAYDTGQLVRAFKRLGRRQQTVAWKSIRDEFLNEFRGTAEDAAAKLTRMQQEGALDLLEQLGPRGKKFADDIRKIAQQENPSIRAIDQGSGSPTHSNQKGAKDARDNVQSPVNKAIGALGDTTSWPVTLLADAAVSVPTTGFPILTAGKIGTAVVDRFGNPSRKVLARATEGLYGLPQPQPQANALASPPTKPRGGGKRLPKPKPEGPQDLGTLLKQLDEAETNAKTRGGAEGKRLLKQIAAERQRLNEQPTPNALATPPRPPVKNGFGGGPITSQVAPRNFTPDERRARPPWTTQDVPDDQQIVRYGAGQANSEPPKAGPGQKITIASGKDDAGKGYTITAEAYNDRGRMVLSPEWPTNVFDELAAAKQKRAEELLFPQRPKPTLVDENYGKPPMPRAEWEVENPQAQAKIDKAVAQRFVGLMNADPSPVHVLALKEGVGLQEIGDIIEAGMPKNKQIFIAKDGGEIAVVDKAWHRQNRGEYAPERWSPMSPRVIKREGRTYGWKEGRPFIHVNEVKPPPTQAGFSFGGKGPSKPPANALAGPPKPKPVEARREAPRGTKSFSDPRLSPGENKTAEMVLNGYTYDEIADEAMTSVDVIKRQAMLAQRKLGDDVKLPRPGMGKRPPGSTKRDAANSLFGEGLDNATIAQRTGLSIGNVRTYRSYWKEQSNAPVASVEGAAYNPPAMPERPFEADYPQQDWPDGPPVDAQGRLTRDRDGRPLDQTSVIIGRNKAPGYGPKSEADRSLRDRIAIIQTLKKAGSSLELVPRPASQASGGWRPNFDAKGRFTGRSETQIANDLDRPVMGLDDQEVITLSHELAHSIDFKTRPASDTSAFNNRKWGIDHKNPYMTPEVKAELESQLQRIYQDLNNPIDGEVKIRTPKDHGYESIDADRELWAEAIRAYMYDPNYIKTVAPDVAFMIRDNVNKNGSLRKTIQFNAVPTIVGVGGLGLGAAALNGQPAEAQTRPGGLRANALASQYGERPGR